MFKTKTFKFPPFIFLALWLGVAFVFYFLKTKESAFFVRDDYDVLLAAKDFSLGKVFLPHNEHFSPFLRLFYWLQFRLFGLDYSGYLAVQIFFHLLTSLVVFFIVKKLTKSSFLSIFSAFLTFLVSPIGLGLLLGIFFADFLISSRSNSGLRQSWTLRRLICERCHSSRQILKPV